MEYLKVGLIGGGFMAKAHSLAWATVPMFFWPVPVLPVRKMIADITEDKAKEAALRYGYEEYTGDWKKLVDSPDIDIVDICVPNNLHCEMAIRAAQAKKHILCEKPLARNAEEAKSMFEAVQKAGVKNMVAYNYRRTPAVVYAKQLIEEGKIGRILNFRATYLQSWSASPLSPLSWRFQKSIAGAGTLGDIGTHIIDLARYLVGDITKVCSIMKTWITERPTQEDVVDKLGTVKKTGEGRKGKVDVDDEMVVLVQFNNGSIGSLEATRNAWGRNNYITLEIHGEKGSLFFNYERNDELQVCFADDPDDQRGFKTIYIGPAHPYGEGLWPIPALGIGYGETKIIECYDFLRGIVDNEPIYPSFKDGYAIALVCEAIEKSAKENSWVEVKKLL